MSANEFGKEEEKSCPRKDTKQTRKKRKEKRGREEDCPRIAPGEGREVLLGRRELRR